MITKEVVEHVAWLARIKLSEEEKEKFARQLSEILEYFNVISKVDTSSVEPTFHVLELHNVFRDDEERESLPQEVALKSARESEDGFVKAPKIL
ncbi:MAG: Asp-tRNA(Asn)/Glu-tRNA(Gln) amidotransferase subunit GatC [Candidatus Jordarchaeales archaeon]|nr:Asp-tRNA(Asn)/Glu-tRNA(Gln) amidotransferase subunit GatC [Candidatus Jordarchaeia archaeon]